MKNILADVQQQIVDILKSDIELSGISILAENNKDIEYEIQNAIGNQGLVTVVMTPAASYIGNFENKGIAWEISELTIQVVENVPVNRGKKDALTGQDVAMRITDWLSSPKYGRNGQFNPVSYEQGEDSNLLVNKVIFKCAVYDNAVELIKIIIPTPILNLEYNGNMQLGINIENEGYTLEGTVEAVDAGTYTITAILNEGYIWEDDTTDNKIINWSISKAINEWYVEPSISKNSWYEDEEDGVLINGVAKFGDVIKKINGSNYSEFPKLPGNYTIDYIVEDTNNYSGLNKAVQFEIKALTVVDIPETLITAYNGNEISLTDNIAYTLTGTTSAIDVGSYTAVATLNIGYKWSDGTKTPKTINWEITKAENEWIVEPSISITEWTEGETAGVITDGVAKFGDTEITLEVEDKPEEPEEPEEPTIEPLTFTAIENSTFQLVSSGTSTESAPTVALEYAIDDGDFTPYTNGNSINFTTGQKLKLRATDSGNVKFGSKSNIYNALKITSGSVNVSGNIMSLINKNELKEADVPYMFSNLFNSSRIVSAKDLELSPNIAGEAAYYGLFKSCPLLTEGPKLPAKTVQKNCYSDFFMSTPIASYNETIDIEGTLPEGTVSYMFYYCNNITNGPLIKFNGTSVSDSFMYEMYNYSKTNMVVVDMTACSTVPSLTGSLAYRGQAIKELLVPAALYNEWIQATNWSTIASKIKAV